MFLDDLDKYNSLYETGAKKITFREYSCKVLKDNNESTPKSKKTRHCEARSDLIILVICILRLPHFIRNDEKLLFGVDSTMYIKNKRDSSNIKACSPFQHSNKLKDLCFAIAYFSYT